MTDEQDFAWSFHEEAYKQALERVAEISEFRSLRAEKPSELDIQKERVKNAQSGLDEIIKGLAADTSVPRRMIEEIIEYRAAAELVGPPAESQALSAPPVDPSPHPAFLVQIELSCVQAEQEPAPELVSQAQAKVEQAPPHEPTPAPATTALAEPEQRPTEQLERTVAQVKPNPAPASTAQVNHPQTAAPAEPAQDAPADAPDPLTTSDIAYCFADLRWVEQKWKKPLGDKPKWLRSCIAIPGKQGVHETRWDPVLIGAALVQSGHAKPNSVRARFQSKPQLSPWLETWKTYEADYLDTE